MKDRILWALGKLLDLVGLMAVIILSMALSFAFGHHVGFKSGLSEKITIVDQKYVMKLKGTKGGK